MSALKASILQKNAAYRRRTAALLDHIAVYGDEQLNRLPASGGWSAMQVVHHLLLVDTLALRYVQRKLGFEPVLQRAGMAERLRLWRLWIYLHAPLKFKAPEAVSEQRFPSFATLADTRRQWEQVAAAWQAFLEALPEDLCDKAVYRHPFVGRLSWGGLFVFLRWHLERHARQMFRTLRAQ